MSEKRTRTFVEARKIHGIDEKVREGSKQYKEIRKKILSTLEEGPRTIPQIAEVLQMTEDTVTYHLMTCRKYGDIEVIDIDDMDEYYIYGLSNKEETDGKD